MSPEERQPHFVPVAILIGVLPFSHYRICSCPSEGYTCDTLELLECLQ